jgi:hypothetical protein
VTEKKEVQRQGVKEVDAAEKEYAGKVLQYITVFCHSIELN